MSRTRKGSKPPGYEFWSRRPQSGGKGAASKGFCHRQERAQGKTETQDEIEQAQQGEPGEPCKPNNGKTTTHGS